MTTNKSTMPFVIPGPGVPPVPPVVPLPGPTPGPGPGLFPPPPPPGPGDSPAVERIQALVRSDVVDGLAPAFVHPAGVENAYELIAGFEVMQAQSAAFSMFTVPWIYEPVHAGPIRTPGDDGGLAAIPATNLTVIIEGVTLVRVDHRNDEAQLRRYVDWNIVLAQLGVTTALRAGDRGVRLERTRDEANS